MCGGAEDGRGPCINGISPTALKIAARCRSPIFPASPAARVNNLNNVVQNYTHGNQGDVKMDWAPTDKDHLFARYSQQYVDNPT